MVAYSSTLAAPKYRRRASTGSVPFPAATLKMASLGTTSIGANVGLQKTLAQRIPSIAFSNIAAPPSLQRANVPRSIDFGKPIQPTQIASEKALTDVGESIGRRINESVFNRNAALGTTSTLGQGAGAGTGAIGGFNVTTPITVSANPQAIFT